MKVTDNSKNALPKTQNVLSYPIQKYTKRNDEEIIDTIEDHICHEGVLEFRVKKQHDIQYTSIAITMRTKGNDLNLALGFLYTEGIIESYEDVHKHQFRSEDILAIELKNHVHFDLKSATRNIFTSSSCGICSKANKSALQYDSPYLPWTSKVTFNAQIIYGIAQVFYHSESIFTKTGGNHAAALIRQDGQLIDLVEDVGRHNALDKLIGQALQKSSLPWADKAIVLSGRISFELVQKATMTGIPLIIALGAPSSLAIEEAYAQNICLIGFAKDQSFNVYSSFERIQ